MPRCGSIQFWHLWYCVQSKPGQERLAYENLTRQDFEVYFPEFVEISPKGFKKIRPLFSGYLFVYLDLRIPRWERIFSTLGVKTLLADVDRNPIPLPRGFVEKLQTHELRAYAPYEPEPNELCRIFDGPFKDIEGICLQSATDRVDILMTILGREQRVSVSPKVVTRV